MLPGFFPDFYRSSLYAQFSSDGKKTGYLRPCLSRTDPQRCLVKGISQSIRMRLMKSYWRSSMYLQSFPASYRYEITTRTESIHTAWNDIGACWSSPRHAHNIVLDAPLGFMSIRYCICIVAFEPPLRTRCGLHTSRENSPSTRKNMTLGSEIHSSKRD